MKESLQNIKEMYEQLISSDHVSFQHVVGLKGVTGVYIIYATDNSILYIGSTNKFEVRFGIDLKHESTHTLMRKFLKQQVFEDRAIAKLYLCNDCKYQIQVCNDKREAEALEHLAIWMLNPKYNK